VAAGNEEFAEAFRRLRNRARCGNADDIETLAFAVGNEEGFRLARVSDQKSRSA
jgi:hypothetical protein